MLARTLRDAGAGLIDRLPSLKALLVRQAAGLDTSFIVLVSAATIYRESHRQIDMLTHLDNKYRQQFDEYLKNSGFEAIN